MAFAMPEDVQIMGEEELNSNGPDGIHQWNDAPFQPGSKPAVLVGIRKEMLPMLKQAGEAGLLWQEFGHLDWEPPFTREKLYKAMRYLSAESGLLLQYQGDRGGSLFPFRWRVKP